MGVVHKPHPDWASHMPVLIKALEISEGPVLEMGMGIMSTPLLHVLCEAQARPLTSYDNESRFVGMFRNFRSQGHEIELITWDEIYREDFWYSCYNLVLVDQKPAEDRKNAIRFLTNTEYVIIHDSNDPIYDYESIYPLYKYRYDYKKLKTWTTVLSNKHELHQFHNTLG